MTTRPYRVAPFLSQACRVLGLSQARVVMRAGLSADFLAHEGRGLGAKDWFCVLAALMAEAEGADGPVKLGRAMAAGPLHPALMAFSASPDIATGIRRLATFKPLIAPIALEVSQGSGLFQIDIRASDGVAQISPQIAAMEVAHFIELFRLFAAEEIIPVEITLPTDAEVSRSLAAFASCRVRKGDGARLVLTEAAARLPIISADTEVFRAIEREMTQRLRDLDSAGRLAERVGREIRQLLPSGRISVDVVAERLRISTRSLQRKLQQEGSSFQAVLDKTRESLALVYLRDHKLSTEETSYLLAYRDPNSFYRAFSDWTGMTPSEARASS